MLVGIRNGKSISPDKIICTHFWKNNNNNNEKLFEYLGRFQLSLVLINICMNRYFIISIPLREFHRHSRAERKRCKNNECDCQSKSKRYRETNSFYLAQFFLWHAIILTLDIDLYLATFVVCYDFFLLILVATKEKIPQWIHHYHQQQILFIRNLIVSNWI